MWMMTKNSCLNIWLPLKRLWGCEARRKRIKKILAISLSPWQRGPRRLCRSARQSWGCRTSAHCRCHRSSRLWCTTRAESRAQYSIILCSQPIRQVGMATQGKAQRRSKGACKRLWHTIQMLLFVWQRAYLRRVASICNSWVSLSAPVLFWENHADES